MKWNEIQRDSIHKVSYFCVTLSRNPSIDEWTSHSSEWSGKRDSFFASCLTIFVWFISYHISFVGGKQRKDNSHCTTDCQLSWLLLIPFNCNGILKTRGESKQNKSEANENISKCSMENQVKMELSEPEYRNTHNA